MLDPPRLRALHDDGRNRGSGPDHQRGGEGAGIAVKVHFITSAGDQVDATGEAGESLLRVAQAAGMPLEGTCEGQMACSTCHVVVEKEWFDRLPEASEEEEDMLDLAAGVRRTSRLSCQIVLDEELDGLTITIPAESHDMSR
ncbi:2Fe-2S iron-sulfur cluster binding domain-containing protein [Qipengyuania sp. 1NDH10]|nr:2Fe-2S iron-sulfur cluster binding domain-containing protein [Qipengyuania vesicularis]